LASSVIVECGNVTTKIDQSIKHAVILFLEGLKCMPQMPEITEHFVS